MRRDSRTSRSTREETPRAPSGGASSRQVVAAFDPTQITHRVNRATANPETISLARAAKPPCVAYSIFPYMGQGADLKAIKVDLAPAISAVTYGRNTDRGVRVVTGDMKVRRLTPLECERAQGFPDGHTAIEGASNSERYAALGNSMAVPVMRWIGERLAFVDSL